MTLKLKKCYWFFCKSMDNSQHFNDPGRLQIVRRIAESTTSLCYPTTVSEMRSSMCLCIVYSLFVPGFAEIFLFLNIRLKKEEQLHFALNKKKRRVVERLKEILMLPPFLAKPKLASQCMVESDASGSHLFCVQPQQQKDNWMKPIDYLSRSLCRAERSYDPTH